MSVDRPNWWQVFSPCWHWKNHLCRMQSIAQRKWRFTVSQPQLYSTPHTLPSDATPANTSPSWLQTYRTPRCARWQIDLHQLGINAARMNKSDLTGNQILIAQYIAQTLGPQQALPLTWLISLTVIYIVILISGLIGNSITILIIFRFRYMQSITNLYLCNLAITDLISLMFSKFALKLMIIL